MPIPHNAPFFGGSQSHTRHFNPSVRNGDSYSNRHYTGSTPSMATYTSRRPQNINMPQQNLRGSVDDKYSGSAGRPPWIENQPLWDNFIPEYDSLGVRLDNGRLGQTEPHVKRPSTIDNWLVHDAARLTGTKSSPLLFSNSLGWGRRHYEPDRPHTVLKNKSNWQRQEVKAVSNFQTVDESARPFKVHYGKSMDRPSSKMLNSGPAIVQRRYLSESLTTGKGVDLMRASRMPGPESPVAKGQQIRADPKTARFIGAAKLGCSARMASTLLKPSQ
jgi:hypothetical protein